MAGEWIRWAGGLCPVPMNTIVEVRTRDGFLRGGPAGSWTQQWRGRGTGLDITEYRIVGDVDDRTLVPPAAQQFEVRDGVVYNAGGGSLSPRPVPEEAHCTRCTELEVELADLRMMVRTAVAVLS